MTTGATRSVCLAGTAFAFLLVTDISAAQSLPKDTVSERSQAVMYWPTVVRLAGHLVTAEEYGPPGFGEDTARDQHVIVPMLQLMNQIDVLPNPRSKEPDTGFVKGVTVVQLVFFRTNPYSNHQDLVGKSVIVTGTLHPASTASHYASTLLWVTKIEPVLRERAS